MYPSANLALPELPVSFMNDDHQVAVLHWREMLVALESLGHGPDRLLAAVDRFLAHNREHFQREETAMLSSGFPPYAMHRQEHERVLGWLSALSDLVREGADPARLRTIIERDIPAWLTQHVETMDRATALWIASHS